MIKQIQKFEYRRENAYYINPIEPSLLNLIGKNGWELVAVVLVTGTEESQKKLDYYFKRPLKK